MKLGISLLAATCFSAITLVNGTARAERFIDTFASPLPVQTIPGSTVTGEMLWTGNVNGQIQYTDVADPADQSNLAGVLGRRRDTTLTAWDISAPSFLSSSEFNGQHLLSYASGPGYSGEFVLEYGLAADLNANLVSDGSVAFEFEVNGDMDDSAIPRPVQLTITVESQSGTPFAVTKTKTITVINDGVYQVPFASFAGVNFSDVDYIKFEFDANGVNSVDYDLIGGLRTTACLQASGSAVADKYLDTFDDAFKIRPLPDGSSAPIMWVGSWDNTLQSSDSSLQTGLLGVAGGTRYTTLMSSDIDNFITSSMSEGNGTPSLSYSTGFPTSGRIRLWYGAQAPLNANFSKAKAFELEVKGDMDDGSVMRPFPLTVTVTSGSTTKSAKVTVLKDGMMYVPFTSFPGINFSDVDQVRFLFDASQVQAIDYVLIGGLRASACIPVQ